MGMKSVVCSYTNTDLDGVACEVAIEALHGKSWEARIIGTIDAETDLVLRTLGIAVPPPINNWDDISKIWLVDTHHIMQIPKILPRALVIKITDHHPGGDSSGFPNADIQNESVGAAATLVAEQFELQNKMIPPVIAVLLQAAILSNTLELRSRSTSPRDEKMCKKLHSVQAISATLIDGMRERRRGVLSLSTELLVRYDKKQFETRFGLIVIGQIEAPGALEILARSDLMLALQALVTETKASSAILNLVDTTKCSSAVILTDPNVAAILCNSLGAVCGKQLTIHVSRVLQRKSDIIPALLNPP